MAEELPVSDASPSLQLFKQLGIRPPPPMSIYTAIIPVVDVTPKAAKVIDALVLTEQNLTGTFVAPALAGRFAQATHQPGVAAVLTLDAITNILQGCKFRVKGFVHFTQAAPGTFGVVRLTDQAGANVTMQWVKRVSAANDLVFESPVLEAPYEMKLGFSGAGVAGETWYATYGIEVLELR